MYVFQVCVCVCMGSFVYVCCRPHRSAIRQVAYHKRYPLFASGSDDGSVVVYHGMVYK